MGHRFAQMKTDEKTKGQYPIYKNLNLSLPDGRRGTPNKECRSKDETGRLLRWAGK